MALQSFHFVDYLVRAVMKQYCVKLEVVITAKTVICHADALSLKQR